jgi:hypothetical protein
MQILIHRQLTHQYDIFFASDIYSFFGHKYALMESKYIEKKEDIDQQILVQYPLLKNHFIRLLVMVSDFQRILWDSQENADKNMDQYLSSVFLEKKLW